MEHIQSGAQKNGGFEGLVLRLEEAPWAPLYRFALGYAIKPLASSTFRDGAWWTLPVTLLCVLFALRLGPAVLRKVLGFSEDARRIWARRRQLAKHYDSYQWRKLLWIGLGLGAYALQSRDTSPSILALTLICILGGGLGVIVWNRTGLDRSGAETAPQVVRAPKGNAA
jgi:hypothetical protein